MNHRCPIGAKTGAAQGTLDASSLLRTRKKTRGCLEIRLSAGLSRMREMEESYAHDALLRSFSIITRHANAFARICADFCARTHEKVTARFMCGKEKGTKIVKCGSQILTMFRCVVFTKSRSLLLVQF
jgi:hypothetical protein